MWKLRAFALTSGRRPHNRADAGYPPEVLRRAVELRRAGVTLNDPAARLRDEVPGGSPHHEGHPGLAPPPSVGHAGGDGGHRASGS